MSTNILKFVVDSTHEARALTIGSIDEKKYLDAVTRLTRVCFHPPGGNFKFVSNSRNDERPVVTLLVFFNYVARGPDN